MSPKTAVCINFLQLQTANIAYFQRTIQLSRFSAYPDSSPSKLIPISGILLYYRLSSWSIKRLREQKQLMVGYIVKYNEKEELTIPQLLRDL